MIKKLLTIIPVITLLILAGCSEDDNDNGVSYPPFNGDIEAVIVADADTIPAMESTRFECLVQNIAPTDRNLYEYAWSATGGILFVLDDPLNPIPPHEWERYWQAPFNPGQYFIEVTVKSQGNTKRENPARPDVNAVRCRQPIL